MSSYLTVALAIKARIEAGDFGPGDELPTTERIAAEYGVSDSTAYHAMRYLRDKGIIRTVQGGGRYVAGDGNGPEHTSDTA